MGKERRCGEKDGVGKGQRGVEEKRSGVKEGMKKAEGNEQRE